MKTQIFSAISQALNEFIEGDIAASLPNDSMIKYLNTDASPIQCTLQFGFPIHSIHSQLQECILQHLQQSLPDKSFSLTLEWEVKPHAVQMGLNGLPGVKNIIAVASGKGGVGKSTTSVNLALALQRCGAKVALLDADIYGPSQAMMLGQTKSFATTKDQKHFEPVMAHGIASMSMAYLIESDETPMVWRGPMVTSALQQMLMQTVWPECDYLIVDLPPGTGDIQLTLAQKIPVSGAVIVTTPQDIALLDAKKALKMFEKVKVSVLGIIENMSTHTCSQCGHLEAIFGSGGGQAMATQYNAQLLGQLPLDASIRQHTDNGQPSVVAEPDSAVSRAFIKTALNTAAKLSLQTRSYRHKFPNIKIETA